MTLARSTRQTENWISKITPPAALRSPTPDLRLPLHSFLPLSFPATNSVLAHLQHSHFSFPFPFPAFLFLCLQVCGLSLLFIMVLFVVLLGPGFFLSLCIGFCFSFNDYFVVSVIINMTFLYCTIMYRVLISITIITENLFLILIILLFDCLYLSFDFVFDFIFHQF